MLATLHEVPGILVDAVVTDHHQSLLFLSLWGNDTGLQELLARLSLPADENGLPRLTLRWPSSETQTIKIDGVQRLDKYTGRAPKESLFGHLAQLWLYDKLAAKPDRVSRSCLLLKHHQEAEAVFYQRVWQAVQDMCPVPLLSAWHKVIDVFQRHDWVNFYSGKNINACQINLSHPEVEDVVTQLVRSGELSLIALHQPPQPLQYIN